MLGKFIKMSRQVSGVKSQDLADFVGISRPTMSYIENNHVMPSIDVFVKICAHLDVDMCDVLKFFIDEQTKKLKKSSLPKIKFFDQTQIEKFLK